VHDEHVHAGHLSRHEISIGRNLPSDGEHCHIRLEGQPKPQAPSRKRVIITVIGSRIRAAS
jgi:hypothetical protein